MKSIGNIILRVMAVLFVATAVVGCKPAKLSTANEQLNRGEYYDAAQTYRRVYNKLTKREDRPLRGEVAYKLAYCYDKLNMFTRATGALENAVRYEYPDSVIFLMLGKSLQAEGKYAPAIEAYEKYLEWRPGNEQAIAGIAGCRNALAAKNKPKTRYKVREAKLFNSRRADFSPMYSDRQNFDQIYFTTSSEKALGDNKSEITGTKRSDIMFARKNELGQWERPEPVEGELNTEMDEGIVSFSPDGTTMYLTRALRLPNQSTGVEIATSKRGEGTWGAAQRYEILNDTLTSVGHPAVSPDGRYLYFCSDMIGGYGGKDIWRVNLTDRIGSLENMGPQINTPGDEMFPYVRTDSLLYFASNGHPGFGGLDLFKASKQPDGNWEIENMGEPMNSAADDFGITFGPGETGFFSSNRGDGRGFDHIYSFELPELKINISGWVVDKDDEPVPGAIIRIIGDDGSNQREVARDDGSFFFKLERGINYVMMAGAPGYLNVKQEFTSDEAEEDAEYGVDFILSSIDKANTVENIFYDFDSAELRPESIDALKEIIKVMEDNPNVKLMMTAHADRHGTDEYNDNLSERRAKSVVDYLISMGVSPSLLDFRGMGKRQPKTVTKRIHNQYPQFEEGTVLTEEFILSLENEEDREAADQINRRTEFSVVTTEHGF